MGTRTSWIYNIHVIVELRVQYWNSW